MKPTNHPPAVPAIEMKGVGVGSLQDPRVTRLEEINWTVNAGEYWVLAGMQGSGKSDLLAMMAGLMPPQSGTFRLFGREMPIRDGDLIDDRLRIGLVFDGGQLLHQLSVRENVALPLRYHRNLSWDEAEKRVDILLELTELTRWGDMTHGNLGRNLQKRTGLARALILEPEVLLLDNPLGGLDVRQAQWWLNLMRDLSAGHPLFHQRPMTLIATAEDLRSWRERAGSFAILRDRRFIPLGCRTDLSGHADPEVKELLAEAAEGI